VPDRVLDHHRDSTAEATQKMKKRIPEAETQVLGLQSAEEEGEDGGTGCKKEETWPCEISL
jgi:hypothetical protein